MPGRLDDFIVDDKPVRMVDAFAGGLELLGLGLGLDSSAQRLPRQVARLALRMEPFIFRAGHAPSHRNAGQNYTRNILILFMLFVFHFYANSDPVCGPPSASLVAEDLGTGSDTLPWRPRRCLFLVPDRRALYENSIFPMAPRSTRKISHGQRVMHGTGCRARKGIWAIGGEARQAAFTAGRDILQSEAPVNSRNVQSPHAITMPPSQEWAASSD